MIELEKSPLWMESLVHSLPSTQQYILYDNIYDFYPYYDSEYGYITFSLSGFLEKHFNQLGYDGVLSYEPMRGFSLLHGDKNLLQTYGFSFEKSDYMEVENLSVAYVLLKKLFSSNNHAHAVIFNFASALKDLSSSKNEYADFFFNLFRDSLYSNPVNKNGISLYNQVTFLFKDLDDFPKSYHNTKIKYIKIPKPDIEARKIIANLIISSFESYSDISKEKREKIVQRVAYLTANMYGKELLNILLEAKKNKTKNLIEFIQTRKLNTTQNPWSSLEVKLLSELKEKLQEFSVICDDLVSEQISNAIKTAYFNFSNLEMNSCFDKPRATMLFNGYHPEEQIQTAQLLSKLIFKNEDSCLTVDMQEYSASADLAKFLNNLSSHMSNFSYGIILFQDIQKADSIILQSVFNIVKQGKILIGDDILFFHGYIIILSYSKSCNESDKMAISENTTKENSVSIGNELELKSFFDRSDASELYTQLNNNIIHFNLLNVEQARSYLEKTLDDTVQRVKTLHKVSIALEDVAKEDILGACLNVTTYYCSAELKTVFHNVFVVPLTKLFLKMNIQESGVVVIKSLQDSRFEVEFV